MRRMITEEDIIYIQKLQEDGVEDKTISKVFETTNILTISNIIDDLKCGDIVIKNEDGSKHAYLVVYKKSNEIALVYADYHTIEEIYYEKEGENWNFVSKEIFNLKNYTAGDNIQIVDGVISATDTTYTAGDNITISDGVISASGGTPSLYSHTIEIDNPYNNMSFTFMLFLFYY